MIYNSPYYGFETKADLFFDLHAEFPHLVGFKEFGGADSLTTLPNTSPRALGAFVDGRSRHAGVSRDRQMRGCGGDYRCRECLAQTGFEVVELCLKAASGDVVARRLAQELDEALTVLSRSMKDRTSSCTISI